MAIRKMRGGQALFTMPTPEPRRPFFGDEIPLYALAQKGQSTKLKPAEKKEVNALETKNQQYYQVQDEIAAKYSSLTSFAINTTDSKYGGDPQKFMDSEEGQYYTKEMQKNQSMSNQLKGMAPTLEDEAEQVSTLETKMYDKSEQGDMSIRTLESGVRTPYMKVEKAEDNMGNIVPKVNVISNKERVDDVKKSPLAVDWKKGVIENPKQELPSFGYSGQASEEIYNIFETVNKTFNSEQPSYGGTVSFDKETGQVSGNFRNKSDAIAFMKFQEAKNNHKAVNLVAENLYNDLSNLAKDEIGRMYWKGVMSGETPLLNLFLDKEKLSEEALAILTKAGDGQELTEDEQKILDETSTLVNDAEKKASTVYSKFVTGEELNELEQEILLESQIAFFKEYGLNKQDMFKMRSIDQSLHMIFDAGGDGTGKESVSSNIAEILAQPEWINENGVDYQSNLVVQDENGNIAKKANPMKAYTSTGLYDNANVKWTGKYNYDTNSNDFKLNVKNVADLTQFGYHPGSGGLIDFAKFPKSKLYEMSDQIVNVPSEAYGMEKGKTISSVRVTIAVPGDEYNKMPFPVEVPIDKHLEGYKAMSLFEDLAAPIKKDGKEYKHKHKESGALLTTGEMISYTQEPERYNYKYEPKNNLRTEYKTKDQIGFDAYKDISGVNGFLKDGEVIDNITTWVADNEYALITITIPKDQLEHLNSDSPFTQNVNVGKKAVTARTTTAAKYEARNNLKGKPKTN